MAGFARPLRCPSCQGGNLCTGKLITSDNLWFGVSFKPAANWLRDHKVVAAACVDCGVVTLRIDEEEINDLRGDSSG